MTFEKLENDLEQRVRGFIQDRYQWQSFVADNFDTYREKAMRAELTSRYRALIDKYCAPGKVHQGLVLSSSVDHMPEEEHIVKFEIEGDTAVVFTQVRFTKAPKEGWIYPHEFEFKRENEVWFLEEVYYNDGSGRYESL